MKKQSFIRILQNKNTLTNILNGFFAIAMLIFIVNPNVKALLLQGLMKVGLFQPNVSQTTKTNGSLVLPKLTLQSSDGKIINLSDQKGKVIFLNFWATWCPPCIAEMPFINTLYEKLKDDKNFVFIMVDVDHDFTRSRPFIKKHQFSLPLYQANNAIPGSLLGRSIPTTVIFDKSGKMVFQHEGGADYTNPKVLAYLMELSQL